MVYKVHRLDTIDIVYKVHRFTSLHLCGVLNPFITTVLFFTNLTPGSLARAIPYSHIGKMPLPNIVCSDTLGSKSDT